MTNEQREAAELMRQPDSQIVLSCPSIKGIEDKWWDALRTLVRSYLDEHPLGPIIANIEARAERAGIICSTLFDNERFASDDKPVTEEWLRSVGFEETARRRETDTIIMWMGCVDWFSGNELRPRGFCIRLRGSSIGLPHIVTSGDVHRLCALLGVELKETDDE